MRDWFRTQPRAHRYPDGATGLEANLPVFE